MIDYTRHRHNDISSRIVRRDIDKLIPTADILGVDLPCCSWSRARRAPAHSSMPSAVRSNAHLMGLPNLNARDQQLVNKHNVLFRSSMRWIKQHQQQGGCGYLENPLTSMVWKTRTVRAMVKSGKFHLVRYDMCQYGTQYKQTTRLMVWGEWARTASFKTCSGRGTCSRTNRPHIALSGICDGVFRTSAAQVYTSQFCNHIAAQMLQHSKCSQNPEP